ncbi:hypothetical protein ACLKA6_008966 [Drosophila palustris]
MADIDRAQRTFRDSCQFLPIALLSFVFVSERGATPLLKDIRGQDQQAAGSRQKIKAQPSKLSLPREPAQGSTG